jgi:hypothetical protein
VDVQSYTPYESLGQPVKARFDGSMHGMRELIPVSESCAPVAGKPARLCKHGCGRAASKGRLACDLCRRSSGALFRRSSRPRKGKRKTEVWSRITREEWERIYHAQNGLCVICLKPLRNRFVDGSTGQTAALDHDHAIEKVQGFRASIRGLLCSFPCNRVLLRHWTPERLERAARYVRMRPAQLILKAA